MKKILIEILNELKEINKMLLAIKKNQEQKNEIKLDGEKVKSIINNHSKDANRRTLSSHHQ